MNTNIDPGLVYGSATFSSKESIYNIAKKCDEGTMETGIFKFSPFCKPALELRKQWDAYEAYKNQATYTTQTQSESAVIKQQVESKLSKDKVTIALWAAGLLAAVATIYFINQND